MKFRALSAAVYLMGGLLSLTLAIAFASWILRPSHAQQNETPSAASEVSPPPTTPPPQQGAPDDMVSPPPPPPSNEAAVVPQAMPSEPAPVETTPVQPTPVQAAPPLPPEPVNGQIPQPNVSATTAATLNLPARDFLEPYIFDAREGRRNPFRPLSLAGDEESSTALGPATPLERFEVEELKLLAIMWDVKNPRAMLMDPNKEIHIVGKDDRIGRRKGYIATIREGEIVIVETSEFNGESVYSTRIMQIQK